MPQLTSIPIIPLAINWEAATTGKALADKVNYAPGTVVDRQRATIIRQSLSELSVEVAIGNRDEILNFLVGRAGKPFRLEAQNGTPGPEAWRCLGFTFRWVSPGLWVFSADFKEVGGRWI